MLDDGRAQRAGSRLEEVENKFRMLETPQHNAAEEVDLQRAVEAVRLHVSLVNNIHAILIAQLIPPARSERCAGGEAQWHAELNREPGSKTVAWQEAHREQLG